MAEGDVFVLGAPRDADVERVGSSLMSRRNPGVVAVRAAYTSALSNPWSLCVPGKGPLWVRIPDAKPSSPGDSVKCCLLCLLPSFLAVQVWTTFVWTATRPRPMRRVNPQNIVHGHNSPRQRRWVCRGIRSARGRSALPACAPSSLLLLWPWVRRTRAAFLASTTPPSTSTRQRAACTNLGGTYTAPSTSCDAAKRSRGVQTLRLVGAVERE